MAQQQAKTELLVQIRDLIDGHFDLQEFQDLCFRLGIKYDNLRGENLSTRIQNLVLRLDRERRLDDLLNFCARLRPKVEWPDLALNITVNEAAVKELLKRYIDEDLKSGYLNSQHQSVQYFELTEKRNALREFIINDLPSIGSAIAWSVKHHIPIVSIPKSKPFLEQIDKAIRQSRRMEVMFLSNKRIKDIFAQIGRFGRLSWDHQVTKDDFKEFLKHKVELENLLTDLDKKLS